MRWLAGSDPIKQQAFEQLPILEYFLLLNQHLKEVLNHNVRPQRTTRLDQ